MFHKQMLFKMTFLGGAIVTMFTLERLFTRMNPDMSLKEQSTFKPLPTEQANMFVLGQIHPHLLLIRETFQLNLVVKHVLH